MKKKKCFSEYSCVNSNNIELKITKIKKDSQ